jgi:phenylalanyl-tRNA synthetase alpha chain
VSSPTALHPIERRVLSSLVKAEAFDFDSLVNESKLLPDQVRRSLEWLSSKKLAEVRETVSRRLLVGSTSPPELSLVRRISESPAPPTLAELKRSFSSDEEFSAALGRARAAGWVAVDSSTSPPVVKVIDSEGPKMLVQLLESVLAGAEEESLSPRQKELASDLVKRGILSRKEEKSLSVSITRLGREALSRSAAAYQIDRLTPEMIATGGWKGKTLRPIDVEAKAPVFYPGRRHPVRDFIREVREAYISMGFTELQGNSVQPAFWNFDALFIPQDHPARDMQDTMYLRNQLDKKLTRTGLVDRVARTHENGWRTGSAGWSYRWSVEEARRLVLRTHNTVLTVRALSESGERETRVFAVSKIYRNENLDYKHLAEFHQMDGIIVGKGLNVRHLMGFLTEFYKKLGLKDFKIWPSYFPYTEPSLEIIAYSEKAKDWIELGGSGVFRPEVTWPLGVKVPVLAWGPGIERLMLVRYGLEDMRSLYDSDLSWYRSRPEIASS